MLDDQEWIDRKGNKSQGMQDPNGAKDGNEGLGKVS